MPADAMALATVVRLLRAQASVRVEMVLLAVLDAVAQGVFQLDLAGVAPLAVPRRLVLPEVDYAVRRERVM